MNQGIQRALLATIVVALSSLFWIWGFLHSPLWVPELKNASEFQKQAILENSDEYKGEKILAEAYWLRYKDIMQDKYWGKDGPQNVWGPRNHYQLNGKKEGRIFAPLPQPKNLQLETQLARAYWQRYPDIARSSVWGKKSQLGVLGPRDHFTYIGRNQGKEWGINQE